MKDIKNAIWFIKESKKFTGYGYFRMLFKENLISKTIWFCKEVKNIRSDKMETLRFDVAYKLLNSRKIYSLVSEYTYWREGDVIFVENNEGVMGKLYFDDELFSFGEIMGEWLVLI